MCLNKETCELSASTSVFGAPPTNCQITGYEYDLYVDFECSSYPTTAPSTTTLSIPTDPPTTNYNFQS